MAQARSERPKHTKPVEDSQEDLQKKMEEWEAASIPAKKDDSNAATNVLLTRVSQQFNLLALLIVAMFLFQAYSFYKLKNIEAKGVAGGAPAQQESPLSQEKIMSYAKEIGVDTGKFEQCLKDGAKKEEVKKDTELAASLKVQGTPGFLINGKFLGGAFPYEVFKEIIDKEIDGTGSENCTDYSESLQQYCKDPNNLAFNPAPQAVDIGNSPVRGPKDAKVTIVEFSDFECPYCHRAYPTITKVEKDYPKDVRVVFKQLPLVQIHPNAQRAAEASLCAGDQGKFWEMYDKMFQVQSQ